MTDAATLSKYLRKVTGELRDANLRIGELEEQAFEPIAIVGIGCRYPGGVRDAEGLWELVAAGGDTISPFPRDRGWPLETLFDPDPAHVGTSYLDEGGFLEGATEFDPEFFGISPREALTMDPQQRLLLEVAWEALEDAGLDPTALAGSETGVFAGVMHHGGYGANTDGPELEGHRAMGSATSVLSGRVAYTLGLEGPAVTVDTACSSSLVAMHLAGQALRGGECDLALAGGVTVMVDPLQFVEFSRQRGLAMDGRCKAFDAAADGTGWAEGVGLVVLERLSAARRNGHEVLAVVRGSAANQDGASNGITAPNGPSQEKVIRRALAGAGLRPREVDAVEAHGTGTPLGDPIEAQALMATYGQGREGVSPLRIGSVKSNLSHTQAAAGVAGVIKMTMAMRHGVLPRTIHLEEPTPHVDWTAGAVELLAEAQPWEPEGRPRRAGVSSFGVSGTNVHLILEEPQAPAADEPEEEPEAPPLPAVPLPLSARTPAALREQGARLLSHLRAHPQLSPTDVGFSLATSRTDFEHRAVALGADREQLLEALAALAAGEPHAGLVQGRAGRGGLALLLPGQGLQWQGMALGLLGESPFFAAQVAACAAALQPFLGFSVEDVLRGAEGAPSIERIDVVQPALFAVMVSLARLWEHHGLRPAALVGHSQGEIAAAHLAGALSLEDAARVVSLRARAIVSLAGKGGMTAIGLPAERVRERIEPWGERISLAVINSRSACTVAGEAGALAELVAACEAEGVRCRQISAEYATHWDRVEAVRDSLLSDLEGIVPGPAEIPFYSSMRAGRLEGEELTPEYWYRSFREPVRFEETVEALIADGFETFVEVSSHPVLTLPVQETAEAAGEEREPVAAIGTLRRGEGGLARFAAALAEAHAHGAAVEWERLFAGQGAKRVPLPTYAFQRKRYWLDPRAAEADVAGAGLAAADHPLLGAAISLAGEDGEEGGWLLTGRLALETHPWLADHSAYETVLLPGTGFVEMALRAAAQCGAEGIEELTIEAPLVLGEGGAVQVQVSVGAADERGAHPISIHSRPEDREDPAREWTANATGLLGPVGEEESPRLQEWPPAGAEPLEVDDLYARAAELGIDYGPAFQGVRAAWRRGEELFAAVELGEEQAGEAGRYGIHPALLDAALHPTLAVTGGKEDDEGPSAPFAWNGVRLHRTGAAALRVAIVPAGPRTIALTLADPAGEPLATVRSLVARPLLSEALGGAPADAHRNSLFDVAWTKRPLPGAGGGEIESVELIPDPELDAGAAAAALCAEVLATLRAAIAGPEDARFAFLTRGAVAVGGEDSPDPAAAAARGLVRSAQAEHPGRFLLIDSDESEASRRALAAALALDDEPQLALREGAAFVPRLARNGGGEEPRPLDPERTVLVTGGTGALGSLFARHLVTAHGARHLLLTSRRGPEAPRAAELAAELEELGAEVRIAACDVGDRSALEQLLGSIPAAHPLGAVIHTAAIFDNALIEAMSDEQLQGVLAAKAGAAWNLHELTATMDLSEFVLFSSGAGTFDHPGQGNYAAANAFLDALAQQRQRQGLAASSVAWGLWAQGVGGPNEFLIEANLARLDRAGFVSMSAPAGLELFERTRGAGPFVVAAPLDLAALRALARKGELAPIYAGLVRIPAGRAATAAGGSLARRLAAAPEPEREAIVVALVAEQVAAVLGHDSAESVDPRAVFKDLGFDSLGAVELRNRLNAATGLRLPSTLVFDHPNVRAVAAFLRGLVAGESAGAPAPVRLPARSEEPIAIVGMSCRYPGGVDSPADLWRLLAAGGDAISAFPEDRGWDLERLYDPEPGHPGTSYVREGGFLAGAAEFDAAFFGIGPREATGMDPQQRLLLEATWEALEDAGIAPDSLRGSAAGVFAGVMSHDYGLALGGAAARTGYEGTTSSGSVVTGRVAYTLGLEGPAVTVDTACSSSLVALHLAAQALRGGECDLALAGGVTVASTPGMYVMFSRQRGLAPDGRCKPFAAAADGTGVSEGVGLVVLERLSEARRNGHEVLAVVRGSATNQDGASNGLTAPNGPSQERVIRQALANAGLRPEEVDAVEAHGTGTTLGDPIEAQALLATYGQERGERGPLRVGAIKSNLSHTQAAAGVAGVIKMALAMREGVLPKTLHLDEPTPHVDWTAGAVELLAEAQPWQANGRPRRAGVSSFGLSGTNAHVILEEAPAVEGEPPAGEAPVLPATPLSLSAKDPEALRGQAVRLVGHLRDDPELDLSDVAFSLATTRATLEHRATAIGADREELLEILGALAGGKPHPGLVQGRATSGKLAFLFSGQGAQRPGMGRELYESFPVFAEALDEICAELDPLLDRSLKELLFAEEGSEEAALLDATQFTQPALFALEVALFRQLQAWDLAPDYLLGHSIGELSAAHVAGVFSLPDACKLIAARGALMGALPEGGAMVAIEAGEEEIASDLPEGLSIAGINAPDSVVVSGSEDAALKLAETWKQKGRKTTRLRVSHAFHSELMEPMLDEFAAVAQSITFNPPAIPVLSNLSGELLTDEQATDPAYWVAQVRQPVRFADGAAHLASQGVTTAIELGPDGVLCAMAQGSFVAADKEAVAVPLLRKDRAESTALLGALASAQANGAPLDWSRLLPGAKRIPLPTYAFQRKRYWLEPQAGEADVAGAGLGAADHPLLGAATSLPGLGEEDGGWLLTGRLSLQTHPWLADHAVHGSAILPGTGFVEMALKAAEQVGAAQVEELTLEAPLVLPERGAVQVQVSVGAAEENGSRTIAIHSRPEDTDEPEREWTSNATGVLGAADDELPEPIGEWPPAGAEPLGVDDLYERIADLGVEYGPAFQGARAAWRRGDEFFAELELGEDQASQAERFAIHPALLDAAFHPLAAATETGGEGSDGPKVPFAWNGVRLHRGGAAKLRVALLPAGEDTIKLLIADHAGEPRATVAGLAARALPADRLVRQEQDQALFAVEWIEPGPAEGLGREARAVELVPDSKLAPDAAAQALCAEVLATLQEAIAADGGSRLAFLTRGAVAVSEGESPDPAAAAVWGLVRSAQAEHPDRFLLIDTDGSEASAAALGSALASESEPQLALREGVTLAPRLARAESSDAAPNEPQAFEPTPLDPERTVLITGATGALGALFARHLVEQGARHLLLTSRRGPEAPGAPELAAELEGLGAEVRIAACDVADRPQLAQLLDSVPAAHPLGTVLHAAGIVDDGVIESLDPERLQTTMAPKARAAWNLHELAPEAELVLFSSMAATFSSPGQGNYAAANAFLDALAQRRRAAGLPGRSIAWGAWGTASEMTSHLGEADRARFSRGGVRPLFAAAGLELFDRACALPAPFLLAADLDTRALRASARSGALPPLLSRLVRVPVRRAAGDAGAFARRLAAAPEAEREGIVVALVAEHVAAVLGHASGAAIDPTAAFKELGFDSLGAVELRNRLNAATGMRLPSTLVFDYPTTAAVGAHVCGLVDPRAAAGAEVDAAIERLRAMLGRLADEEREQAAGRIRSLLSQEYATDADAGAVERIRSASAAEILEIVNDEIGAK
jgi:pimaricinolide synthase PimS1